MANSTPGMRWLAPCSCGFAILVLCLIIDSFLVIDVWLRRP